MKIFFGFFLCGLLLCCQQNNGSVLSPDRMENIMWELAQADAFTQEFLAKDSSKNLERENLKLQMKIFAKNKTDRKTFYNSYDFYLKHEEFLRPLLDTIVVRNGRIRENIRLKTTIKSANEQVK